MRELIRKFLGLDEIDAEVHQIGQRVSVANDALARLNGVVPEIKSPVRLVVVEDDLVQVSTCETILVQMVRPWLRERVRVDVWGDPPTLASPSAPPEELHRTILHVHHVHAAPRRTLVIWNNLRALPGLNGALGINYGYGPGAAIGPGPLAWDNITIAAVWIHEILHAMGLVHVSGDPWNIMAPDTVHQHPWRLEQLTITEEQREKARRFA